MKIQKHISTTVMSMPNQPTLHNSKTKGSIDQSEAYMYYLWANCN